MNTPACRFHVPGPEYSDSPAFAEFGPPPTLRRKIENYCWRLGLIRFEVTRPIQDLGAKLVALGNSEDEALAKACAMADDVAKHLAGAP